MMKWQPIETVPTDGTSVLIWNSFLGAAQMMCEIDGQAHHDSGMMRTPTALVRSLKEFGCNTHWMAIRSPRTDCAQEQPTSIETDVNETGH